MALGGGGPAPLHAVVGELADGRAVPGDRQTHPGRIRRSLGRMGGVEKAFGGLGFANPADQTPEHPYGVGGLARVAVFFDQALRHPATHEGVDRAGMLASDAEGLQKTLAGR